MKLNIIIFVLSLFAACLVVGCNNNPSQERNNETAQDTLHQLPKMPISQYVVEGDSLYVLCNDWFLYYPLGEYENLEDIEKKYPFMHTHKFDKDTTNIGYVIETLSYKKSNVVLWFEIIDENADEWTSGKVEIAFAKIVESDISFVNGIHTSMSKQEFMTRFPFTLPSDIEDNIHIICLQAALDGMWHNYYFSNNKLDSIIVKTDFQINPANYY
ncbi:MAG: hypothetical protein LBV75_04605 [Paludibacter sp.]|jgi:hypothetical protein|nr:hypothetical protein [Paludibacter sp.]